jgi:hypothetical protein
MPEHRRRGRCPRARPVQSRRFDAELADGPPHASARINRQVRTSLQSKQSMATCPPYRSSGPIPVAACPGPPLCKCVRLTTTSRSPDLGSAAHAGHAASTARSCRMECLVAANGYRRTASSFSLRCRGTLRTCARINRTPNSTHLGRRRVRHTVASKRGRLWRSSSKGHRTKIHDHFTTTIWQKRSYLDQQQPILNPLCGKDFRLWPTLVSGVGTNQRVRGSSPWRRTGAPESGPFVVSGP